jgi:hypothetical protein
MLSKHALLLNIIVNEKTPALEWLKQFFYKYKLADKSHLNAVQNW